MLDKLRLEDFSPRIGETFRGDAHSEDGDGVDLVLIEAEAVDGNALDRPPFSLVFRAPPGTVEEQGIYVLRHEEMGELTLFLVPLGPDAEGGMHCEAVFT